MPFAKGDAVTYRMRDIHGDEWVCAIVDDHRNTGQVAITTTDGIRLFIPATVLTKIKTVWRDTLLPVSRAVLRDKP
jgi:hypothetical protein